MLSKVNVWRGFFAGLAIFGSALALADGAPTTAHLPAHLTLQNALEIARRQGLDILIAEANVQGSQAGVYQAAAVANPLIGASVGRSFTYNPGLCAGCSDIAWSIGISDQAALTDLLFRKRTWRIKVADKALGAAKLSRVDAQRSLELQVKQQYIQTVFARDTLDFAKVVQQTWVAMVRLVRVRYDAGAVSEADLAKVTTEELQAEQAVDHAEQDLLAGKINLAFLLGVRGPMPVFETDEDLPRFAVPAALANVTRDDLIVRATRFRPDLRAAQADRERAEAAISVAKRMRVPDIGLSAQFSMQGWGNNATTPPTVSVGITAPIPLFYRYRGEIGRALADFRTQDLQVTKLQAEVAADVQTAFAAFEATQRRVQRSQSGILEQAMKARNLVQIQYEKGAASLLELLDAERTFISSYTNYMQELADYWTSVYQLEFAVGGELSQGSHDASAATPATIDVSASLPEAVSTDPRAAGVPARSEIAQHPGLR